jgi:hypothetical protein
MAIRFDLVFIDADGMRILHRRLRSVYDWGSGEF